MTTATLPAFSTRRRALSCCFLAGGIGLGAWGANLPALSRRASISEAELGTVLLCFATGAIFSMTNSQRLMQSIGAGRASVLAAGLFGMVIMSVALVDTMVMAGVVAVLGGITFGALDVGMNKEAAVLETEIKRPIMSSFHAIFSAGTLISAMSYAALVQIGLSGASCLLLIGGLSALVGLSALPTLQARAEPVIAASPDVAAVAPRLWPSFHVLILGSMAFLAFFAEGAIMDWIAVYMVRVIGTGESMGAYSYAVFAGAMTFGRLVGDRMTVFFGPVRMFRLGSIAVALGLGVALSVSETWVILMALVVCGLGVANVIPLIFSAAGRLSQVEGAMVMSRVLTMGYAGILIGPAIIGFIAELITLRFGLAMVAAAMLGLGFCGHFLRGRG